MCPSNVRRQPVSLTQSELDEIKIKSPNYLNEQHGDILPYTSNPDNPDDPEKNYYICPRYWCLLTNSPISEEDVKSGKCGKIVENEKVKSGHYVYEFNSDKQFPGFLKNKTMDNKYLPCCFKTNQSKKYNKGTIQKEKEKVNDEEQEEAPAGVEENKGEEVDAASDAGVEPRAEVVEEGATEVKGPIIEEPHEDQEEGEGEGEGEGEEEEDNSYIINAEKVKINAGRWGYLPVSIQKFFKEISCKINQNKKSVCLLRYGIRNIKKRSFLACIANAIFFSEHTDDGILIQTPKIMFNDKNPDADTMTKRIIDTVSNIDLFITYQNGTLVDNFAKTYDDMSIFDTVPQVYKDSKLYQRSSTPEQKKFFLKVLNALENFIIFLKDENVLLDYTYLWDIISSKNPLLFENGINLVILNIPDNDSTNNIEFICPSNSYSSHNFDPHRRTLFIIKRDDFYEPIYKYTNTNKGKILIQKTFSDNDPHKSDDIKSLFTNIIKPIIKQNCSPKPSNSLYKFKQPVPLDELHKKLISRKYDINNLVLNLRGKIIGVVATKNGNRGFLPCEPTVPTEEPKYKDFEYIYITDEPKLWNTYENTLMFLRNWYKIKGDEEQQPGENCSTFCKVIEDDHIVGFLTNTNQFIQLSQPAPNTVDNIHSVNNNNYLVAENEILTSNKTDTTRVEYINKIKYEYNFYNAFRKTIRILLTKSPSTSSIKSTIDNNTILYPKKIELVKQQIMELVADKIEFSDEIDYDSFKEISTCITYQQDKCETKNPMCLYKGESCVLIIPRQNLVTPAIDNSEMYYTKIADEFIRFNNIKNFMFQSKNYLSFDKIGYNLYDNEIIMLESLLTPEYFDKLTKSSLPVNKYIINNSRDNTNPITSLNDMIALKLNEIVQYDKEEKTEKEEVKHVSTKISSVKLRECFPANCTELEYSASCQGTFQFIIDVIRKTNGIEITEENLREILVQLYENYTKSQLINIWAEQGKRGFANKIKRGELQFKDIIKHQTYYLTNLDLWLLLNNFRIPTIFISPKVLLETGNRNEAFIAVRNPDQHSNIYVFIVIPTIKEEARSYKVIEQENRIYIDLSVLIMDPEYLLTRSIQEAMRNMVSIDDYINRYQKNAIVSDVSGGKSKKSKKQSRKNKSRKNSKK